MPYKEKEISKLYYTIGEVARIFEVNTSHIRFWSKQFDVIKPATNKKGNRLYTQSDIDNFKKIYHLVKEKGFTLKGAKIELKGEKQKFPGLLAPMKANGNIVAAAEPEPELFGAAMEDDFVEKMAVVSSLQKIRKSLLEVEKELAVLDAG